MVFPAVVLEKVMILACGEGKEEEEGNGRGKGGWGSYWWERGWTIDELREMVRNVARGGC